MKNTRDLWPLWLLLVTVASWALVATIGLLLATYVAPVAHWGMLFNHLITEWLRSPVP